MGRVDAGKAEEGVDYVGSTSGGNGNPAHVVGWWASQTNWARVGAAKRRTLGGTARGGGAHHRVLMPAHQAGTNVSRAAPPRHGVLETSLILRVGHRTRVGTP